MKYNAVTAPVKITQEETAEPVTLEQAKAFCKIDLPEDDLIVMAMIKGARQLLEAHSNTSFVPKTIKVKINNSLGGCLLPYGPVKKYISVTDNGVDYNFESAGDFIDSLEEPASCSVVVEYQTGFDALPRIYIDALLQQIYYMYDNRNTESISQRGGIGPIAQQTLSALCRPSC